MDKWSEEKSTPIDDIKKLKDIIKNSTSPEPNAILVNDRCKKFIKEVYGIDIDEIFKQNGV